MNNWIWLSAHIVFFLIFWYHWYWQIQVKTDWPGQTIMHILCYSMTTTMTFVRCTCMFIYQENLRVHYMCVLCVELGLLQQQITWSSKIRNAHAHVTLHRIVHCWLSYLYCVFYSNLQATYERERISHCFVSNVQCRTTLVGTQHCNYGVMYTWRREF